jgi:ribosome biogenesis GTPase A
MSDPVIQWFPGHMAKTLRQLEERLAIVDVVVEVVDARLPTLSANPGLGKIAQRRPWVTVATRADLADVIVTKKWTTDSGRGHPRVAVEAKKPSDVTRVTKACEAALGSKRTGRMLVVGIPNSGKSTLINGLVGRHVARTENRAGVTRVLQWFRISPRLEIVDSPGILMPKIESRQAQWMLAITGALPRERYDVGEAIMRFHAFCVHNAGRAGLPPTLPLSLPEFALKRGFRRHGNELDLENAALAYLKDFNDGKMGRYSFEAATLETPPLVEGSEGATHEVSREESTD